MTLASELRGQSPEDFANLYQPLRPGRRCGCVCEGELSIANETGIGVIAQGVETAAQQDALMLSGGYGPCARFSFQSPVNEQEVTRLLVQQRNRTPAAPDELLVMEV